jgi:general secretion pathway protein G
MSFATAILSGKGGVGKTTISLSLARQLSIRYTVWLVDLDLFNRGTTSAIWESESSIPLSVAQLVHLCNSPQLASTREQIAEARAGVIEKALKSCYKELIYSEGLAVLPAARAREGREASYMLWHGLRDEGPSAYEFLTLLSGALSQLTPGCIVLFDGHGGLDELSIGAALVSDLTLIINEPDLITFTGSITLFNEISRTCQSLNLEPMIQFIINRIPPNKTIRGMEKDFGDVLRTVSPSPQPVAAYFPLERELFGIFGDNPFVSEILTEFLFSKKVQLLAHYLEEQGVERGCLEAVLPSLRRQDSVRRNEIIRTALRRRLYMRGDKLLVLWLALAVVTLWILYNRALNAAFESSQALFGKTTGGIDWSLISVGCLAFYLAVLTRKWFAVQWRHLRNAQRVRSQHGRWRRLGESPTAPLRQQVEEEAEKRGLWRGLSRATLVAAGLVGLISALIVPNFLDALQKAKQKRTVADMRNVGTAMFSWLTDQLGAAAAGQSMRPGDNYDINAVQLISQPNLSKILVPQYLMELQSHDGWKNPYEYRLDSKNPMSRNVMVIRSPGADGKYEASVYTMASFDTTEYDMDIVWADGFFVRFPSSSPSGTR